MIEPPSSKVPSSLAVVGSLSLLVLGQASVGFLAVLCRALFGRC